MMNYTTHSNKQIISVSIIVASLLVIGTGTMMIILLVIFLVRSQSEIRWKLQRRAALRKKPGMNENSYGDIELIADHGTSNSGDGIDLPHSDSNAIINATGGATPSDHSGTSPTSPQLYSEANSGKRMVEVAEDMAISHQHIEPAEYSVPVPSNCTSAVEKPPQTYAEVVIKQCLPPLSLHEQPVTYSVIQVAQAHSPPPDLPPKPPTQPPPPPPLPPALSESLLQESEESIVNHQLDTKINIDLVIQQLQELTPHWRAVGQAAYIEPAILDEIAEHFKGNDSDSFAEVMNQCFIPNDTLWADIGDICQRAGFTELADKLYDSYRTGKLPVEIEDEEVKPLPSDPAPLIPPRGGEKNEDIPPALPPPLAPEDMPDNQPSEHRKPPALPPSTRYPSDLPPRPPKVSH